jgi:hypothetical protein
LEQRVETLRPLEQRWRFETFFDALASMSSSARLIQMFGLTIVRAHVPAVGAKGGQEGEARGRSRGAFTTKIHAKSYVSSDIITLNLTGGGSSNACHFDILPGPDTQPSAVISIKPTPARPIAKRRGSVT